MFLGGLRVLSNPGLGGAECGAYGGVAIGDVQDAIVGHVDHNAMVAVLVRLDLDEQLFAYAASTTTVVDSTISDNRAVAGPGEYANGGGIVNAGSATLTLIDSAVVGNLSLGGAGATGIGTMVGEGLGGGITNGATLTLVGSTVADNQAVGGDGSTNTDPRRDTGSAGGGGIENFPGSLLTLLDSTVRGNVARGGSTDTGLGGAAFGGGINNLSGTVMMTHSTVADNQAIGGNGGSGFKGGLAAGGGLEVSRFPGIPDLMVPPGGPASASVIDLVSVKERPR